MTTLGKYELHEEIGRGGFGTVYRATDSTLKRDVALKVLHPQLTVEADFLEKFRNEARLIAALDNPHIVTIYELGEADGRVFIAMRYMAGGSLKDRLAKEGALPFEETLRIIQQVCAGLEKAHKKGLVHRDIKPANILFDEDGNAVISDFGLAKAVQQSSVVASSSLGVVGTPAYRAPEIWQGKPAASAASDIYSLGCVLSEMLSGKVLFDGDTPEEILTQHLIEGPKIPDTFPEEVPKGMREMLSKTLAKDPKERYPHVLEMLSQLRQIVRKGGQEDQAIRQSREPVQGTGTVIPESKPRNSVWVGVMLAVTAAIALGVYRIYLRPDPPSLDMVATQKGTESLIVESSPTTSCGLLNGSVSTTSGVICSEKDSTCTVHFKQEGGFPESEILMMNDKPAMDIGDEAETWSGQVHYDNGEVINLHTCRRDVQSDSLICGGFDEQGSYQNAETAEILLCRNSCCLLAGQERVIAQEDQGFFLTTATCCENIHAENVAYFRYPTEAGPLYLGFDLVCEQELDFSEECAKFEAYVGAERDILWVDGECCPFEGDYRRLRCEGFAGEQKVSMTKIELYDRDCKWETEFQSPYTRTYIKGCEIVCPYPWKPNVCVRVCEEIRETVD